MERLCRVAAHVAAEPAGADALFHAAMPASNNGVYGPEGSAPLTPALARCDPADCPGPMPACLTPVCVCRAAVPMSTPLDIRKGLTKFSDVHHKLNWGIISASAIASDWIKCLQDVPVIISQPVSLCL